MGDKVATEQTYLREHEAAQLLRLAVGTLQNKRVSGGGPAFFKFGARVLYSRQDLEDWAKARRRTSTSDVGVAL